MPTSYPTSSGEGGGGCTLAWDTPGLTVPQTLTHTAFLCPGFFQFRGSLQQQADLG